MSTVNTRLVQVNCAEKSNGVKPSEDRIFLTDNAVIVLDGASQPEPAERNGAWMAETLGSDLKKRLENEPDIDLGLALETSIKTIAEQYNLQPGTSPSTTVSIVRWNDETVDILVLCDSPVVVLDKHGKIHVIQDNRLAAINEKNNRVAGFLTDNQDAWQKHVAREREYRNKPDGYWVAEADPEAARHAIRSSFPRHEIITILVMTDGVSIGIEQYGIPPDWNSAINIARDNPAKLINVIQESEAADSKGHQWPRSKHHDDKTLAVIYFSTKA